MRNTKNNALLKMMVAMMAAIIIFSYIAPKIMRAGAKASAQVRSAPVDPVGAADGIIGEGE